MSGVRVSHLGPQPLESNDFRGCFSYSLSITAQDLRTVTRSRQLIVIFIKLYYTQLVVGLMPAMPAVHISVQIIIFSYPFMTKLTHVGR